MSHHDFIELRNSKNEYLPVFGFFKSLLKNITKIYSLSKKINTVINTIYGSNTVCFVAPYLDRGNDGYYRRIRQIDSHLNCDYKVYLDCTDLLNREFLVEKKDEEHFYIRFDSYNSVHLMMISKLLRISRKIYIHSIHPLMTDVINFFYLGFLFKKDYQCVLDVHGVVPEELEYYGNKDRSVLANQIESYLMQKCDRIVCITKSMIKHLKQKYQIDDQRLVLLPIMNNGFGMNVEDVIKEKKEKEKKVVIYSGGLQKWQKVDLMNEVILKTVNKYDYHIYIMEPDKYKKMLNNDSIMDKMIIRSKNEDELRNEYLEADFGFVLRDDNTVNNVACPTKIIDYMAFGVIPIMYSNKIGDFDDYSLEYVKIDDVKDGILPSDDEIRSKIRKNRLILELIEKDCDYGKLFIMH